MKINLFYLMIYGFFIVLSYEFAKNINYLFVREFVFNPMFRDSWFYGFFIRRMEAHKKKTAQKGVIL